MRLLAAKPLLISGLAVGAVGLSAAGGWLSSQSAPVVVPTPTTTIQRITIIKPGVKTVIIKPGATVAPNPRPGSPAQSAAPRPSAQPGSSGQPGPTTTVTQPGPGVTVSVSATVTLPVPTPTLPRSCVHPPGHKCRHLPHPVISLSVTAPIWLLP